MKRVYRIYEYDMIGAKFYGYELQGEFAEEDIKVEGNKIKRICPNGDTRDGARIEPNKYYDLSFEPKGIDREKEKFLPYFADVREDLPYSSIKVGREPITYENCQLMVERRGLYNFFWHEPTQQQLLIAINSHGYTPVLDKVI